MTSSIWEEEVLPHIEEEVTALARGAVNEVERRFPRVEILDAFSIFQVNYWQTNIAEESFHQRC